MVNEAVSLAGDRPTSGVPPVCDHRYVRASPLGSYDPEPLRVTGVFSSTSMLPPAISATGALLALSSTVITTSSVSDPPRESVTLSVNLND